MARYVTLCGGNDLSWEEMGLLCVSIDFAINCCLFAIDANLCTYIIDFRFFSKYEHTAPVYVQYVHQLLVLL